MKKKCGSKTKETPTRGGIWNGKRKETFFLSPGVRINRAWSGIKIGPTHAEDIIYKTGRKTTSSQKPVLY